ncbi:Pre-rRNA-processing protein ESF2 [Coniella lustricola]|uniref:18S rRNA factor 2 n=1 Tax=Coniella lustricola TaxID=2025994 RepID=A0A2T2ZT51_9PEZI|nr:Pre-rRNA-processing protein ESF2 [Coniella lustricola]
MAPEKRNAFLDAEESDDDVQGYESEDDLQKGGRTAKRRKLEDDSDFDDDDADDLSDNEGSDIDEVKDTQSNKEAKTANKISKDSTEPDDATSKQKDASSAPKPVEVAKLLTKKNLVATEAAVKKSGVVYLSRIPPFMKPAKLRSLLEPYGKINRIFLTPQDPAAHTRRVRAGGNRKKMYTEGWVEFVRKKDAKAICELLNARTIGGKKGNYYRDDIWSLIYLKGFKWHNLTEQIAAESAERSNRMMAELSRTTRENTAFVRNVERAKMLDGMQTKNAQKKQQNETADTKAEPKVAPKTGGDKARIFKQVPLAKLQSKEEPARPSELKSVASRIF